MKLARAYEVLKDPQTRKHYDLHGDSPDSVKKQQYHSYTYYRDQFGIYDDDPIIVTLSRNDYGIPYKNSTNEISDIKSLFSLSRIECFGQQPGMVCQFLFAQLPPLSRIGANLAKTGKGARGRYTHWCREL